MSHASLATTALAAVLLVSCSSGPTCDAPPAASGDCPDLVYQGKAYMEWREVTPPRIRQELGDDATYPACNTAGTCDDRGVGDNGATDVWLAEGVDPAKALIGYREGMETFV